MEEKYVKLRAALQHIARDRNALRGGYLARWMIVEIARKVLLECGHDWTDEGRRGEDGGRE